MQAVETEILGLVLRMPFLGTGSFLFALARVPSLLPLGHLSPVDQAALGPSVDQGTSCIGGFVRGAPC